MRGEQAHALAVRFDDSRVHRDHRDRLDLAAFTQERGAFALAGCQRFVDLRKVGRAVSDCRDQPLDRVVRLGDTTIDLAGAFAPAGTVSLDLVMVPVHQTRDGLRLQQLIDDTGEDALLQRGASDRAADVARSPFAMTRAADATAPDDDH